MYQDYRAAICHCYYDRWSYSSNVNVSIWLKIFREGQKQKTNNIEETNKWIMNEHSKLKHYFKIKLFVNTFDKDFPPSEHVKLIKVEGGLSAYFCITCTSTSQIANMTERNKFVYMLFNSLLTCLSQLAV